MSNHVNITLCSRPFPNGPAPVNDRPYSLRNSSVWKQVETLAQQAQAAADDLFAAAARLETHESDATGDAVLDDPSDVVACLTPAGTAVGQLVELASAMREASR